jgi:RHS repeat-associated protein
VAVASWVRDDAGNVVAATLAIPGRAPVTTVYGLDRCGRPVIIHDPVLGAVTIDRDPAGRPTAVAMPLPRAAGLPARLVERRTWVAGRLAGWRRAIEAGGRDTPVVSAELRHDLAGRVVAVVGSDGRRTRYAYDPAGQLVAVGSGGEDWRFTWDRAGRLVGEETPLGPRRFAYDAAGQLTGIEGPAGAARIEWDRCGRRLGEHGPDGGGRRFRWDAAGRLTGVDVVGPGGVTRSRRLVHDPLGRLAEVDGAPVRWDPTGPLERLWSVGGHPQPAVLAPLVPPSANGIAVADGGFVLDPWGVRPHRLRGLDGTAAGDGGAAGSFVLDVGHGPDHLDPGTGPAGPEPMPGLAVGPRGELVIDGLAWLGARAYDPATRSFLSPDPLPGLLGHPWTSHPYQYAANDPVGWADPTGLRPVADAELAALRDGWHDDARGRHGGDGMCWPLLLGTAAIPAGTVAAAGPRAWTYGLRQVESGLEADAEVAGIDRQADVAPGHGFLASGMGSAVRSALVGAPVSGGLAAGIRQAIDGDVDWAGVGIDMVAGAAAGGFRPPNGGDGGDGVATAGSVASAIGGLAARAIDGLNPFDSAGMATSVLGGGVAEAAGGPLGARNPGLEAATAAIRWRGSHVLAAGRT